MSTLIIISVVITVATITVLLVKYRALEDKNNDGVFNSEDLKITGNEFKEDADEAVAKAKAVAAEVKDVVSTIQGKPTKAKLGRLTKKEIVATASQEFGVELDITLKKTNLVNKLYKLYHK